MWELLSYYEKTIRVEVWNDRAEQCLWYREDRRYTRGINFWYYWIYKFLECHTPKLREHGGYSKKWHFLPFILRVSFSSFHLLEFYETQLHECEYFFRRLPLKHRHKLLIRKHRSWLYHIIESCIASWGRKKLRQSPPEPSSSLIRERQFISESKKTYERTKEIERECRECSRRKSRHRMIEKIYTHPSQDTRFFFHISEFFHTESFSDSSFISFLSHRILQCLHPLLRIQERVIQRSRQSGLFF